jgi:4'-phosphopantetheinyl transferase
LGYLPYSSENGYIEHKSLISKAEPMPLFFKKALLDGSVLAAWKTDESEEELYVLAGSRFETDKLIQASNTRLRTQRLAIRVLLKLLTGSIDLQYFSEGKPFLSNPNVYLSISHSHDMVALIINPVHETGIDLEAIDPKILRVKNKFMSSFELSAIDPEKQIDHLYVYWCAKEALYKLYGKKGIRFIEDLPITPFTYSLQGGRIKGSIRLKDMNREISLCYEKVKDHMLVYVTNS